MAKIENTVVYPTVTPAMDDLLIATDVSDDNKTVTFLVSDLAGGAGILQGLQSVLDTGNTAIESINLTGDINVLGTVAPTTITASGVTGLAGQILSSTGTGIQWINSPTLSCCELDDVLNVGNTATIDIITSASIEMNGAAQTLALSNNTDMTLAANCSITTEDDIILGNSSVLNFNTTSVLNDSAGSVGTAGAILTVNGAGTGVEWSIGIPTQSMPTLQEVLTAGNTAVGVGINLTAGSPLVLDAASNITSGGTNTYNGINTFNGVVEVNACLEDSLGSCGINGQVLTSTGAGVEWTNGGGVGLQNLSQVLAVGNTATNDIILNGTIEPTTITDSTSSVGLAGQILSSNGTGLTWIDAACCNLQDTLTAGNTSNTGIVLTGTAAFAGPTLDVTQILDSLGSQGLAGQFLSWNGAGLQWVTGGGGGGVTTVTTTDGTFIDLTPNAPTAGAVTVTADLSATGTPSATTFLRGDNTWATPAGAGGVTSVTQGTPGTSTGLTTPLTITPTTGAVVVDSNAYDGGNAVGHVPRGGSGTTFLRGDGTWATPSGSGDISTYTVNEKFALSKASVSVDFWAPTSPASATFSASSSAYELVFHNPNPPTSSIHWPVAILNGGIYHTNTLGICDSSLQYEEVCSVLVNSVIAATLSAAAIQVDFRVYKWNACTPIGDTPTVTLVANSTCEILFDTDGSSFAGVNIYRGCCQLDINTAASVLDTNEALGFFVNFPGTDPGNVNAIFQKATRLVKTTP